MPTVGQRRGRSWGRRASYVNGSRGISEFQRALTVGLGWASYARRQMFGADPRVAFVRRFAVACVVVSVVAAAGVVVTDQFSRHEFAKRTTVRLAAGLLAPAIPAKPANFLLFGHDEFGNSDTMMVVHVDPAVRTPLLVSFPRDLMVNIPGHGLEQLNAAFPQGGAGLLIKTMQTDFHIPIQHYLQVDFSGFPKIVDAIGSVKVWFPTPVHDPYIGLNIPQRGCISLNGQMSLAYVRSRHYYVPDNLASPAPWSWNYPAQQGGQGWTAVGSDIDRIPRQQYFLRTLAQAAISRTGDNPLRIIGLVDAVMTHLTSDPNLTLDELKALVRTFRQVKPADVEMTTLPWAPDPANPNRVVVAYPAATAVLDQLANFTPPPPFIPVLVKANTITVRVVNGSGVPGIAEKVLNLLVAAGFRSAGPAADADRSNYAHTQIRWTANTAAQGVTLIYATGAKSFGEATTTADLRGADVLVVVGRDWNTLQHHLTGLPGGPRAHRPANTTSTVATSTTTTPTTVDRRYIPVDPKTGGILVGCPT
jgi:LCP family protein required for cell wall assembly